MQKVANGTLILATKEVNTNAANAGDVISYVILIKNVSSASITNIFLYEEVHESLEVEERSIGINEVSTLNQTLQYLKLPEIGPGETVRVDYNANIVRVPKNDQTMISNDTIVYYNHLGKLYYSSTNAAMTTVNRISVSPSHFQVCLTPNKEVAVIGERIDYELQICPLFNENYSNIVVTLNLSEHQMLIPGSICVNGQILSRVEPTIVLPDMMNECSRGRQNINIQFSTQVRSKPNVIRPLIETTALMSYQVGMQTMQSISNEALVEVSTISIFEYEKVCVVLPCEQVGRIERIDVINPEIRPSTCYPNTNYLDVAFLFSITYLDCEGMTHVICVPKTLLLDDPVDINSLVHVWVDKRDEVLEEQKLILDIKLVVTE